MLTNLQYFLEHRGKTQGEKKDIRNIICRHQSQARQNTVPSQFGLKNMICQSHHISIASCTDICSNDIMLLLCKKMAYLHVRWQLIEVDPPVLLHDFRAINAQLFVWVHRHNHRAYVGLDHVCIKHQ